MTVDGDLITRIQEAIPLREAGRSEEAQAHLAGLEAAAMRADPFTRMYFAHTVADVQPERRDELDWDLRALEAFDEVTEEHTAERGVPGGRAGILPSLHLNLAEDYLALGDPDSARAHADLGRAHLDALGTDPYGDSIRTAFADWDARQGDET